MSACNAYAPPAEKAVAAQLIPWTSICYTDDGENRAYKSPNHFHAAGTDIARQAFRQNFPSRRKVASHCGKVAAG
jgi:hypothetical protein